MSAVEIVLQVGRSHVGVDLRRDRRGVTKMRLHVANVDAGLDQVRTTGVAERMWEDPPIVIREPGGIRDVAHDAPDRAPGEPPAARVQEHRIGVPVPRLSICPGMLLCSPGGP